MKINIKALAFTGLIISAIGCSKEEVKPSIVGTYTLSKEITSGCNDLADNSNETKTCSATDCETLSIAGDGTFSMVVIDNSATTSISGNYVLNGSQITFSFSFNGIAETDIATFTLSNSQLVLTYEQDSDGCTEIDTYTRK